MAETYRKCAICGGQYPSWSGSRRFCCDACRDSKNRTLAKMRDHPDLVQVGGLNFRVTPRGGKPT